MSRIGKKIIVIPSGVTLKQDHNKVHIKGPKGELFLTCPPAITLDIKDNNLISVKQNSQDKAKKSLHGLIRNLIANNLIGVSQGFEKKLEIQGVGYRVAVQGKKVILNLGHSHPIEYNLPAQIEASIDQEKKNILIIKGIDKQLVGQTAAVIRGFKKPEPYKGKGIRYLDEVIIRKAGKTATKEKTA